MPLTLDENHATYQIRAYQPGSIQINDTIFQHSVIVAPHVLIEPWEPQTFAELQAKDFQQIIALEPAILLIGTGATLQFPDIKLYGELINHRIGVEMMNTHAACRTYNALTAEERNVVAALIIR